MPAIDRARDPMIFLHGLEGPIWVSCPRCSRAAQVIDEKPYRHYWPSRARLSCTHCGLSRRDAAAFVAARANKAWIMRWAPRCDRCGRPAPRTTAQPTIRHGRDLRVRHRCTGCGHTSLFPAAAATFSAREGHDPSFGLPLLLTTSVGRNLLWVYNRRHLDLLTDWLGASLRERGLSPHYMSMMARLPRWMKLASVRSDILAAIDRLRARADAEKLP